MIEYIYSGTHLEYLLCRYINLHLSLVLWQSAHQALDTVTWHLRCICTHVTFQLVHDFLLYQFMVDKQQSLDRSSLYTWHYLCFCVIRFLPYSIIHTQNKVVMDTQTTYNDAAGGNTLTAVWHYSIRYRRGLRPNQKLIFRVKKKLQIWESELRHFSCGLINLPSTYMVHQTESTNCHTVYRVHFFCKEIINYFLAGSWKRSDFILI